MKLDYSAEVFSQYMEALETADMGIWSWDVLNDVLSYDSGILKLYELNNYTDVKKMSDWYLLLHQDDVEQAKKIIFDTVHTDFELNHLLRIKAQSGAIKVIRTKAKKIKNSKGELTYLLGVNWDVTIDFEKNLAMQNILREQSKLATLGKVTSSIAHEVNNPLSIIVGKASLLERDLQTDVLDQVKVLKDIQSIQKNAERITKIISSLNSFSRNSMNDPFQKTSLLKICDDAFEIMKVKFKSELVDFTILIDKKVTYENCIMGRESEIIQVLINLLNNALDAAASTIEKWVRLSVAEKKENYEISITDSGSGISEDVASQMMEPYYTTKTTGFGTGLGLSLSQQVIKSHNGTLNYVRDSKNTEFLIRLKK